MMFQEKPEQSRVDRGIAIPEIKRQMETWDMKLRQDPRQAFNDYQKDNLFSIVAHKSQVELPTTNDLSYPLWCLSYSLWSPTNNTKRANDLKLWYTLCFQSAPMMGRSRTPFRMLIVSAFEWTGFNCLDVPSSLEWLEMEIGITFRLVFLPDLQ